MNSSAKHPRSVALISALGALLVSAACGGSDAPPEYPTNHTAETDIEQSVPSDANDSVQFTGASWATSYGSIEELTQSADLIVLGTAARVQETNTDEFTAGQQQHSLTFTDTPVSIDEVFKGDLPQGEVLVHQTGGVRADGTTVEIKSAPLLETNTRYLLFLRNDPNSDTFVIIGGPDGRFIERGGELFSLSAIYPDRNIQDLGFSGKSLDAVRQEVSATAGE